MTEFNFSIGANVHCEDGRAGRLHKLVVDPHSRRVTDLIVKKGFLQKKDRVLPVSVVKKTTDDTIYLSLNSEELPNYREYREVEFTVPAPGWEPNSPYLREEIYHWASRYGIENATGPIIPMIRKRVPEGIPSDVEAIGRDTRVKNREGPVGQIDHLLVDQQSGEITHLVLRKGVLRHQVVIPVDWVESVDDDSVRIRGNHNDLKQLRHYTERPEADILDEVRARLRKAPFHFENVVSSIENGVLRLSGIVKNVAAKRHAEQIARSVSGVIDVKNTLDTGTAVVARVTAALEADPRTHLAVIEVINERGIITLIGDVDSVEVRQAAEEIAAAQPGVISVINALEVKPRTEFEDWVEPAVVAPYIVSR